MKVLHVITGLNVGGAEMLLCRAVAALQQRGIESEVVCLGPTGPLAEKLAEQKIPLHCLGMQGLASLPSAIWKLRRLLKASAPDAVHTWMYHADLVGGIAAKLAGGIPVTWSIHHAAIGKADLKRSTYWIVKALAILSRWLPRRIISCSRSAGFAHADVGYRGDRMQIVPNGVDTGSYQPDASAGEAIRVSLGIPSSAQVVGIAGRFHPLKNYPLFFESAIRLQQVMPDVHFIACGKDVTAANPEIETLLKGAPDRSKFHLLGMRADLPALYNAMDLFTLTSKSEAFPLTLGEAMACGLPCVSTDVGDCRVLVGKCGAVVPPGEVVSMAGAWKSLLQLPKEEFAALGQVARERVVEHFSISTMLDAYTSIYREISAPKTPVSPVPCPVP
jgi:glycosyltransferase involved in cell wall biosynthesis